MKQIQIIAVSRFQYEASSENQSEIFDAEAAKRISSPQSEFVQRFRNMIVNDQKAFILMSSNEVAQELALLLPNENLHEECVMKIQLLVNLSSFFLAIFCYSGFVAKIKYFFNKMFCSAKNKACLFIVYKLEQSQYFANLLPLRIILSNYFFLLNTEIET